MSIDPYKLLLEAAEALSDMVDLADAWATCGPETYTLAELKRRNAAERVLEKLLKATENQ